MKNDIQGFGFSKSLLIFGGAAVILFIETHLLIPFLTKQTGWEPIIFWFLVAGLGLFLPMFIVSYFILKREGRRIDKQAWTERLRFKKMNPADWLWNLGAVVVIGILSVAIMKVVELLIGKVDSQPSFMYFEPLTPDRYWILLLWLPYWLLNIMGEEVLWRGVILPKQESVFKENAWLIHGFCWAIFHIPFGWHLLVTMIPILFITDYHYVLETFKLIRGLSLFQILFYNYPATQF